MLYTSTALIGEPAPVLHLLAPSGGTIVWTAACAANRTNRTHRVLAIAAVPVFLDAAAPIEPESLRQLAQMGL